MTSHCLKKNRAGGFTLIELLVVIGIIAVLIGLLLPVISRVKRASYEAATRAQLSTIANAIQQYQATFASFPGPLPNSQLGLVYYGNGTPQPSIYNPNGPVLLPLKLFNNITQTVVNFPQPNNISGAENLVLGLCGGLEIRAQGPSFVYNPLNIWPDGTNPAAKGASGLYYPKPSRAQVFLDVKPGQISKPDISGGSPGGGRYVDAASRIADDSCIPEFIDQFPDALPILYLRANVGATAICGIGGKATFNGAQLVDNNNQPITPQYDLAGLIQYTRSRIGTTDNRNNLKDDGLQDVGDMTNAITDTTSAQAKSNGVDINNGVAYFKDPGNPGTSNQQGGNARQRNGYILISPGVDRIYGTADDIIYPGSLQP